MSRRIASARLLKLAQNLAKATNVARAAEIAFAAQLRKEFPECADDNDGLAENLTYGGFSSGPQTRERLTDIIHGAY